jgi:hypothetical protein
MNVTRTMFFSAIALVAATLVVAGCGGGGSGPAPVALSSPPLPTPSPPNNTLYVDHSGILYEYALPLSAASKPRKTFVEAPGSGLLVPQLAVSPYGAIAIVTTTTLRIFRPPIVSLDPSHAKATVALTPAITQVGPDGAVLADAEYDPNSNLWLLSTLGEVSQLAAPITNSTQSASLAIQFGAPGTKTSGFFPVHGSFDVNATLYVFAANGGSQIQDRLFKTSFPYAKPPSSSGLNLDFADFVDSSQYPPTNPNPVPVILGQYFGPLQSPPPGQPPPPPVNRLSQFAQPLNPVQGFFPDATVNTIVGAVAADAPRSVFYTLDQATGRLDVYPLPLAPQAKPTISLRCLGGPNDCNSKSEHLFIAP